MALSTQCQWIQEKVTLLPCEIAGSAHCFTQPIPWPAVSYQVFVFLFLYVQGSPTNLPVDEMSVSPESPSIPLAYSIVALFAWLGLALGIVKEMPCYLHKPKKVWLQ